MSNNTDPYMIDNGETREANKRARLNILDAAESILSEAKRRMEAESGRMDQAGAAVGEGNKNLAMGSITGYKARLESLSVLMSALELILREMP